MSSEKKYSSVRELLSTPLSTILAENKNIISVKGEESISSALEKLLTNKILSVPVFSEKEGRYVAFIDVIDIVVFALKHNIEEFDKLGEKQEFTKAKCLEIANISKKNPYLQLLNTDSVKKAVSWMCNLGNLHRVPILDLSQSLVGILSQSQLVSHLSTHIELLPPFVKKTVGELVPRKKVISVTQKEPVKSAFLKMKEFNISGIAVVDGSGVLVGNVSASDIKMIGVDAALFGKLNSSVAEVLPSIKTKANPITVKEDTKISEVFSLLTREKIHHTFIVDKDFKPIGIISLTDVLLLVDRNV